MTNKAALTPPVPMSAKNRMAYTALLVGVNYTTNQYSIISRIGNHQIPGGQNDHV